MKFSLHWKELLIVVIVVAAIYGQALKFDFVNYDDPYLILDNQEYLSQPLNILTSFTSHVFTTRAPTSLQRVPYYRPMLLVCLIVEYQLWHISPMGYHLFNILIHATVALLIVVLLRMLTIEALPSLLAGILFIVHPIQTETVAWIAGLNDLLLAFFILPMVMAYIRYRESREKNISFLIAAIIFFTLAIFTKESAAFYFLLLPAYDICTNSSPWQSLKERSSVLKFLPFLLIIVMYVFVRQLIFGVFVGAGQLYDTMPLLERCIQLPATIAAHCWFILFPNNLSVDHPAGGIFWFHQPWLSLALIFPLALMYWPWRMWRTDRMMCFGILWFIVGLLPILNLIPLPIPILEHRLYVPFVGLCIVTGRLLATTSLQQFSLSMKKAVVGILVVVLGSISFVRLPVWHDSGTLWSDAIAKYPSNMKPYRNLAGYYFNMEAYDKSIEVIHRALKFHPDDMYMYSQLSRAYSFSGQLDSAAGVFRYLIAQQPNDAERYLRAGQFFADISSFDSALVYYSAGLHRDSNSYVLLFYIGKAYDRLNEHTQAEDHLLRSIEINPKYSPPYFALGDLYARAGQTDAAIQNLEDGMKISGAPTESIRLLAMLYSQTGRTNEANELVRRFGL